MNTILKNQYETAKEILSNLEKAESFYFTAIELKFSAEQIQDKFIDMNRLYTYFMIVMGNAKIFVFLESWAKNSDNTKKPFTECKEYFARYEQELLESGAIEYGDTLSDEQKLAYYHQQELEQQYYHEFECQY